MARPIALGPVYWVCGTILTLLLSFALVFLGIVPWELIGPTFLIAWGGGQIMILLGGAVSLTREGVLSSKILTASAIGLIGVVISQSIIGALFGLPLAMATDILLVNVLFAWYEETLYLGVKVCGRAANMPDAYIMLLCIATFVPYHAMRYPVDALLFILVLAVSRLIIDGVSLMANHSDPGYVVHTIVNVLATIFGGGS
jgi:hypothetical protein